MDRTNNWGKYDGPNPTGEHGDQQHHRETTVAPRVIWRRRGPPCRIRFKKKKKTRFSATTNNRVLAPNNRPYPTHLSHTVGVPTTRKRGDDEVQKIPCGGR